MTAHGNIKQRLDADALRRDGEGRTTVYAEEFRQALSEAWQAGVRAAEIYVPEYLDAMNPFAKEAA